MITFVKIIFIYFWTAYFLVVNQCLRVFNHGVKLKTSFWQICLEIFNSIGTQINVNFLPWNQWVFPYIYLQKIAIFKRVSSHKNFLHHPESSKLKIHAIYQVAQACVLVYSQVGPQVVHKVSTNEPSQKAPVTSSCLDKSLRWSKRLADPQGGVETLRENLALFICFLFCHC